MTPQRDAGQITRCPYCHHHVKAASLLRHQKRSVRCRAYQVFEWLEGHGYERLKVADCLWHRFVVVPAPDPQPFMVEVPYPHYWYRPSFASPPGGWTPGVSMPHEFWDLAALEPPGQGPDGMPRLFWGPTYVSPKLRVHYGIWVHRSFREPLVWALEHAMAEEIVQFGGAIGYKNCYKRQLRYCGHWVAFFGWFAYRMGQILERALKGGDLQAFVDRYQTGTRLSEVPDKRNDNRIACPHCGKKVLPRQLARHQTLSFCKRAAYRKEGLHPLWRLYPGHFSDTTSSCLPPDPVQSAWDLREAMRHLGVRVERVIEFGPKARVRFIELWVPFEQIDWAQGLLEAAIRQARAEARRQSEPDGRLWVGGLLVSRPNEDCRYIVHEELVGALSILSRGDLDLAVEYVLNAAASA